MGCACAAGKCSRAGGGTEWPNGSARMISWPFNSRCSYSKGFSLPRSPARMRIAAQRRWVSSKCRHYKRLCLPFLGQSDQISQLPASPVPVWQGLRRRRRCPAARAGVPGCCWRSTFVCPTFFAMLATCRETLPTILPLGSGVLCFILGLEWSSLMPPAALPPSSPAPATEQTLPTGTGHQSHPFHQAAPLELHFANISVPPPASPFLYASILQGATAACSSSPCKYTGTRLSRACACTLFASHHCLPQRGGEKQPCVTPWGACLCTQMTALTK